MINTITAYWSAMRMRSGCTRSDNQRDAGLTTPEDIVRTDDISYESNRVQVMDIYCPKGTSEVLPTIVSIHGGGYVYGDKERYQYYCMSLAQRGFTVVNFTYRLAPEHRFPAPLQDTNAVMAYICAHAQQYHIDTDNLFMVGDSAGAQLCSQYSAAVTNPEYAGLLGLNIPAFTLRAIGLNCGMYRVDPGDARPIYRCYFGNKGARFAAEMDVLGHITANYPPSFIMSATGDFLLEEAQPMGDFLTQKGVENEVHIYGDADNRPCHVFHCDMRSELGKRCNDEQCDFFRRHIVRA